jgi:hypothetical protein
MCKVLSVGLLAPYWFQTLLQISAKYEDEDIVGSPATFTVTRDLSQVKVMTSAGQCKVGSELTIKVNYCIDASFTYISQYTYAMVPCISLS